MDYRANEKKWQKKWEEAKLFQYDSSAPGKKWYVLEMFSYPSGAKLHVGHWYNYGPDGHLCAGLSACRAIMYSIPWGLMPSAFRRKTMPSRPACIPRIPRFQNIATMEAAASAPWALSFDWDYEVKTCMPDYYKWTQWLLFAAVQKGPGLPQGGAGKLVPLLQHGAGQRAGNTKAYASAAARMVTRRNLTQWFFKITDYADELVGRA